MRASEGNEAVGGRLFAWVPPERWTDKSAVKRCDRCGKAFGIFRVPNNCHSCGQVFCSSCLSSTAVLPGHPGTAPVPVCDECASAIQRVQRDSEMLAHHCFALEERLDTQKLQLERLCRHSGELHDESVRLEKEKEALQVKVRTLELQLEAAAAAQSGQRSEGVDETGGSTATSPVGASTCPLSSSSSPLAPGADLAELERKKKQMDLREATLQEALRKVSSDAARLVSQRTALQEQERTLQATVMQQLSDAFESQRADWEAGVLEERARLRQQFQSFMRKVASREKRLGCRRPDRESSESSCASTPLRAAAGGVPQAEVEALEARHTAQRQALEEEAAQLRQQLEDAKDSLSKAEAALREREQQQQQQQQPDTPAEYERRARAWEEDRLILQGSVSALKRSLAEANAKAEAAEARTQQLEAEKTQWMEYSQQQQQQPDAAANASRPSSSERSHTEAEAEADAQAPEAGQAPELKLAVTEAALERLRADHDTACEQYEALVARLQQGLQEAEQRKSAAVAEEQQKLISQHSLALKQLRDEHAKEKECTAKEYETKLREMERRLRTHLEEAKADKMRHKEAAAKRKAEASEAMEALKAESAREAARLKAAIAELKRARAAEDARWQGEMTKALDAQSTLLQRQHAANVDSIRSSYERQREAREEAAEADVERIEVSVTSAKDRSAASVAMGSVFSSLRLSCQTMLEQQAVGLAVGLAYLRSVSAVSAAEVDKRRLAERQLKAAKRESQGHEQRATEQAQEALRLKRVAAALSDEVAQLKDRVRRSKRAEGGEAERRASAAVVAAPNGAALNTSLSVQRAEGTTALAAASAQWAPAAVALLTEYADAVSTTVVDDMVGSASATITALAAALAKYRAMGRRNAAALEQTTRTIRAAQDDLRSKAHELTEREEALEQREARLAQMSAGLLKKRQAVAGLCRGLQTVAAKLRDKAEETDVSIEAVATAAATAAAAMEASGLDGDSYP